MEQNKNPNLESSPEEIARATRDGMILSREEATGEMVTRPTDFSGVLVSQKGELPKEFWDIPGKQSCESRFGYTGNFQGAPVIIRGLPDTGWDQTRINAWQDKIFGLVNADPMAIWDKLQWEMVELFGELRREVRDGGNTEKLSKEIADVHIVLCQLAGKFSIDMQAHVDAKMDINEARKWNVTADGTGQHQPE